jgi:hypothetical protein
MSGIGQCPVSSVRIVNINLCRKSVKQVSCINTLFALTKYTGIDKILLRFIPLPSTFTHMNRNVIAFLIYVHILC